MSDPDDQLGLAAEHVAAARLIVARQLARIARLRAAGHPTLDHERMLTIFISTLTIFEDHERDLRFPRPMARNKAAASRPHRRGPAAVEEGSTPDSGTRAQRYRDQAEHGLRMAQHAGSLGIRMLYLEIADHYTVLAEAEERLARHGVPRQKGPTGAADRDARHHQQ